MSHPTADYLATQVLTAPPQRLRLLLISGAIRCVEKTRTLWQAGEIEAGGNALVQAREIVTELLTSLESEQTPELAQRITGYYAFVLRELATAGIDMDPSKLLSALEVLRVERDTWSQVCQQLAAATETSSAKTPSSPPPLRGSHAPHSFASTGQSKLSLEA